MEKKVSLRVSRKRSLEPNSGFEFNEEFWQDGFRQSFETGELSDITLVDQNGKEYKSHKIVLFRKSEFFKKLILENPLTNNLNVPDPASCLAYVLEYLYLGQVRVQPSNIDDLLNAAEFYGIPGLTVSIMQVVQEQFSTDKDLIFLYLHHGEQARIACSAYIRSHFSELWEAGCFDRLRCSDLSPTEFFSIIIDDGLEIHSEHVVCNAVSNYLLKNKSQLSPENITMLLGAIRFPYISTELMVKLFTDWKEYLPPAWHDAVLWRLCQRDKLDVPEALKTYEPRPSYAKGLAQNILSHHLTGGTCRLIEYNFYNGATAYNAGTLEGGPTNNWANNGCLIDDPATQSNSMLSYRTDSSIGSTWTNSPQLNGVGVLVVDLTQNQSSRTLSRFTVFQMISDGATTGIQISGHPTKSSQNPPLYGDNDWVVVLPWKTVGPAVTDVNPPGVNSGNSVRCTNEFKTEGSINTRYLKIEVRNDGTNGNPNYIELRQIKGYSV